MGTKAGHQGANTARGRSTRSVDEAAEILGISRSTAYECVKSGELPSLRFRGRIVIPLAALDEMLGVERPAAMVELPSVTLTAVGTSRRQPGRRRHEQSTAQPASTSRA